MIAYIILIATCVLFAVYAIYNGIQIQTTYNSGFGKFFIFLGLVSFVLGIFTTYRLTDIYLSQGTYKYKDGTYIVYTDNVRKEYDVDFITNKVEDTGLTKEEFEQLLKDKNFTKKE